MKIFKNKIILLCFAFYILIPSQAQWVSQNVLSSQSLFAIDYYDDSTIFLGGVYTVIKTSDRGNSWKQGILQDISSTPLYGSKLQSMHYFDKMNGIATGTITLGNSEVILSTNNGGLSWNYANLNNNGKWPRVMNDLAFVGSTGYAVGTNGRILKSTNSGANWSLKTTGVLNEFSSVYTSNATTIFATGDSVISFSTDGGDTWNNTSFSNKTFYSISFSDHLNGFVVGQDGVVLRTIDGGASWNPVSLPMNRDLYKVIFTSSTQGYISGDGVFLKTMDGGNLWEKEIIPKQGKFYTIDFYENNVFAVGADGQAMSNMNPNIKGIPIANFTSSTALYCQDSIVHFSNLGSDTYSYQWIINGEVVSRSKDYTHVFTNNTQNYLVSLVASNGYNTDTLTKNIHVEPSLNFDFVPIIDEVLICKNYTVNVSIQSDQNVLYQLKQKSGNIGEPMNGTGGTVDFYSGPIYNTDTLTLVAIKKNACGSHIVQKEFPIKLKPFTEDHREWNEVYKSYTASDIASIQFLDAKVGFATFVNSGTVIKTVDGGNSWSSSSVGFGGLYENEVDFVDENIGYVANNGVFKSIDGGKTFTEAMFEYGWYEKVEFINKDVGFVVSNGKTNSDPKDIYKTINGAQSWKKVYTLRTGPSIGDIFCVNKDTCFCSGGEPSGKGFGGFVLRSTDGGETWNKLPTVFISPVVAYFGKMHFINGNEGFVVGGNYINKTKDGGMTWEQQSIYLKNKTIPLNFQDIKFVSADTGYAVGSYLDGNKSYWYKTTNRGECWQFIDTLEGYAGIRFMSLPDSKNAFIGGYNSFLLNGVILNNKLGNWARFDASDTLVCAGEAFNAKNKSIGYTSYKWFVDGVYKQSTIDLELVFSIPGKYTIKMLAYNGVLKDSMVKTIRVVDPLQLTITSEPKDVIVCKYLYGEFWAIAKGIQITYQWEVDRGTGFVDLVADSTFSNVSLGRMQFVNIKLAMDGYKFRCRIMGKCAAPIYSNEVLLTVKDVAVIWTQPLDVNACSDNTSKIFSITATGSDLIYQWQAGYQNLTNNTTYKGVNTPTLTVSNITSAMNNTSYSCKVTGSCNNDYSKQATLIVPGSIGILKQPVDVSICPNTKTLFKVVGYSTVTSYQWQVSTGGEFEDLVNNSTYSNVTTSICNIDGVSNLMDGFKYRCILSTPCQSITSNSVSLNVYEKPKIVSKPKDQTICLGLDATFSVLTGGDPNSYIWQVNKGAGFINLIYDQISQFTAFQQTLVLTNPPITQNGYTYRCLIYPKCGAAIPDTSAQATLLINNCLSTNLLTSSVLSSDVQVYPNPTTGKFNLQYTKSSGIHAIKIIDSHGNALMEKENMKYLDNTEEFDISELSNGIYIVQCLTENKLINIKLIKF